MLKVGKNSMVRPNSKNVDDEGEHVYEALTWGVDLLRSIPELFRFSYNVNINSFHCIYPSLCFALHMGHFFNVTHKIPCDVTME